MTIKICPLYEKDMTSHLQGNLILSNIKDDFSKGESLYTNLLESCNYISRLTDGNALQVFQKIKGNL